MENLEEIERQSSVAIQYVLNRDKPGCIGVAESLFRDNIVSH